MNSPAIFQGQIITKNENTSTNFFKNLLLQNQWANFTKLGTKNPLVKGIQVCSNEESRPFLRGDNYDIAKIHWRNLKIFFLRITEPISTTLSAKHPLVKGIQVCSNKERRMFPKRDNYEITEIHWRNPKIFFCRTIGSISNKLGIKHP